VKHGPNLNWLTSNNFNVAPKLPANKETDYLKKKAYGKTPGYLTKIKNEIQDEYNLVKEMQIEEQAERDRQKMLMPEEERQELIAALKRKWEQLHLQYQNDTCPYRADRVAIAAADGGRQQSDDRGELLGGGGRPDGAT